MYILINKKSEKGYSSSDLTLIGEKLELSVKVLKKRLANGDGYYEDKIWILTNNIDRLMSNRGNQLGNISSLKKIDNEN